MTTEQRKELKTNLKRHYGSITKVAKEAGCSHAFVNMVLAGKRNSQKVLTTAAKVLLSLESEHSALIKVQNDALKAATKCMSAVA